MIDANLLFILSIILIILIGESTLKRAYAREAFRIENFNGDGCNVTNGCLPCGVPCREKCNRNVVEGFDINHRRSSDYLHNYEIQIKENCAPNEVDMGDSCVKTGCPVGFEQGEGGSNTICYPKCLPNYESNGSSRCFQVCPPGYETQGTQCYRPPHSYQKHTVQLSPQSQIARHSPIPLINTPVQFLYGGYGNYGNYVNNGYYEQPNIVDRNDSWYLPVRMNQDSWTNYTDDMEYFDGNIKNSPLPEISQSQLANSSAPPLKAQTTTITTQITPPMQITNNPYTALPQGKINKDRFIAGDGTGCPYGYALSGGMCYENCPPNYKDIDGVSCMREGYIIDRPSYDRGSGIPYTQTRPKYARMHPGL